MPFGRFVGGFVVACCLGAPFGLSAQRQDTKELLQRVAAYVLGYEQSFSAVVCEERYTQRARLDNGWQTRALHSEAALVQTDGEDWRLFRDVLSVDGVRLQDRGSRLEDLFGRGNRGAAGEARRITEESARYNIGPVARTLNVPTLALAFLRAGDQKRSRFTIGSRSRKDGREIVDLRFEERDTPRMIYTRDRAPAAGRAWVDAADGTVRGTELRIQSEGMLASIMVTYRRDDTLALWVPDVMAEAYYSGVGDADTGVSAFDRALGTIIDGHATYTNCRRFSVDSRIK
jgi:hypothetical protein